MSRRIKNWSSQAAPAIRIPLWRNWKANLKTKKSELKSAEKEVAKLEAKKAKADQKAAEEAKKAEAEDVLKKLLASGVSADEILAKLK